ncbi:hypothetical protein NQ317_008494, partial [Molorchus minor]
PGLVGLGVNPALRIFKREDVDFCGVSKNAVPKPNRNHVPKPNGCGSLGVKIGSNYLPIGEMTKCCDTHDICYDTCNKDKEICDVDFKRCLYKYCDSYEKAIGGTAVVKATNKQQATSNDQLHIQSRVDRGTCKGAAKMLFTGTLTLGCKAYLDAQKEACFCPFYGWKDKKKSKYSHGADYNEL